MNQDIHLQKYISIDSIHSWMVTNFLGILDTLSTIIIIDLSISQFETFKIKDIPTIEESLEIFNLNQFYKYPRFKIIICNIDSEFSSKFILYLKSYNTKVTKLSRRNPESNAITKHFY